MRCNFLYRDTKLSKGLVQTYKAGTFLLEYAYTDCTKLRGGIGNVNNVRYLFISNQGVDFSAITEGETKQKGERIGLVVFQRSAVFRVLDVYSNDNKTQILLTPDNYFNPDEIEQVVEAARADFDELIDKPILPELDTNEWQDRLFFPIGMSDEGVLHSLEQ